MYARTSVRINMNDKEIVFKWCSNYSQRLDFLRKFNLIESNYQTLNLILSAELFLSLCRLLQQNPGTRGEHLTRQLSLFHTCFPRLPSRWGLLCPLMIGLNGGGSVDFFTHGEYGFSHRGSWCYSREWVWNSKTKLLHCFWEVTCQQGFTTDVWY